MKKYVIFSGDIYYPEGGFHDYSGSYDTLAEAMQSVAKSTVDWWQIVDRDLEHVVAASYL